LFSLNKNFLLGGGFGVAGPDRGLAGRSIKDVEPALIEAFKGRSYPYYSKVQKG
jgi:hypothetical protein